jgi:riboflavin synthase
MFTGLVHGTGVIASADGGRFRIEAPLELSRGASIAVNGVCLTVVATDNGSFEVDVIEETLRRSSLGELAGGDLVNLETPLRVGDPLDGHIVQGHVDGTGTVAGTRRDGDSTVVGIEADPELLRYVVEKGSIAVDGVSLTVARVDDASFDVSLIPETLDRTNLGGTDTGRTVNLEVDIVAKYVERLVAHGG